MKNMEIIYQPSIEELYEKIFFSNSISDFTMFIEFGVLKLILPEFDLFTKKK